MKCYHFILLWCTVAVFDAGINDYVWLRGQDINNISEELQFHFYQGEKWTFLYLKESKYYQNAENTSYFTVRCMKKEGGHCARTLEGILTIEDKDFQITPVSFTDYMSLDTNYTLHFLQEYKGYDGKNISSNEDVFLNNYYLIARIQVNDRTIQVSDISASSTVNAGLCALQGQTTFTILTEGIIADDSNNLIVNVFVDNSDSASATLCNNSELNSYTSPSAQCFNLEITGDNATHDGHIIITAADDIGFSGANIIVG